MNVTRIVVQLLMVVLSSFGIGTLMEFYKKKIRKDQAGVWEVRIIAGVLSCLAAVGFKITGLFTPVITAVFPNLTVWIDVVLYAIVIFVCQLQADMRTVKTIVKIATQAALNDKAAIVEELRKFILEFNARTKINVELVVKLLIATGVTEDTIEGYLKGIGVDDNKAQIIMDAFKEAIDIKKEEALEVKSE